MTNLFTNLLQKVIISRKWTENGLKTDREWTDEVAEKSARMSTVWAMLWVKLVNLINFVMSKIRECMGMVEILKFSKFSLQNFNNMEQVEMGQACCEGTMKECVLSRIDPMMTRKRLDNASTNSRLDSVSILSRKSDLRIFAARIAAMFVLVFTLEVGNVWGQVSIPYEWTVSAGKGSLPSGVTHSGLGDNYGDAHAPYYLRFDTQGDYIQIYTNDAVAKVTFRVKMIGGATSSKFKVQSCSTGNGSYSDIQEFTCSGSQNDVKTFTTTSDITSTHRYFRIIMSEKGANVGFGYLKMDGVCSVIDVTGGSAYILPKGSTTYTANDWKSVGAPTAYAAAEEYNINGKCVTLTQVADYNNDNGLQFAASNGVLQISGITSTYGIDVEIVCSGTNGFKVELSDASTLSGQTGTVSISTNNTSATLKISKNTSNAGYVKYIKITPKSSSCSNIVSFEDNSPSNGSISFTSSSLATCSETASDRQVTMTIDPAAGYTLTGFSYSSGNVGDISPNSNSGSPSLTENSADAQEITLKFDQDDTGTCTANATFSEMVVTSWTWTMHDGGGDIPATLNLYVGQSARIDVAYNPSGVLSSHKAYTRYKNDTYINWSAGAQPSDYATIIGRASTGESTTEVRFEHADDTSNPKAFAEVVNVKVLPMPLVHFVDNVHNESFSDVVATLTDNALTNAGVGKTPSHVDLDEPGTGNTCEKQHLHLIGWIDGEWPDYDNYMSGTADKPADGTITSATGYFYLPNADIDLVAKNGHTYYAIWGKEVTP